MGPGDCEVNIETLQSPLLASYHQHHLIIRTLGKVKTTGIERGTLSAFEDFLCALIRGSFDVTDVLKDNGVISVCQQHQLKDLSTAIAQSDVARRKKISTEKKECRERESCEKKNKS